MAKSCVSKSILWSLSQNQIMEWPADDRYKVLYLSRYLLIHDSALRPYKVALEFGLEP